MLFYNQLRDIWIQKTVGKDAPQRLEVLSWLSKTLLDTIGLAGNLPHSLSIPSFPLTAGMHQVLATASTPSMKIRDRM